MVDMADMDPATPAFVKSFRSFNLRYHELELPATFVNEHGHNFQRISILKGPSGISRYVGVRVHVKRDARVNFSGAQWKAFVVENGFKVGDRLMFSLVAKSSFLVRIVSNPASRNEKGKSTEQHNIPSSSTETSSRSGPSGNVKNDVIYGFHTLKYKAAVEALVENLRCPHFVTITRPSHLRDSSNALVVSAKFMEKYGEHFTEVQFFEGPSGNTMDVRFSPGRVSRFTTGWNAFHKENGIRLGDVLLFSLCSPAHWLVQVVENDKSEELEHVILSSSSDLD